MRIIPFLTGLVLTLALIFALNKKWGAIPALGKFLSPQQGFWQNAEPTNARFDEEVNGPDLKGKVNVYLDDRLVPHVFAENEEDVYYVQGFLHAKYRLWQMDFNSRAAAGRLSEVLDNPALLDYDRLQRRSGMVFAAENMLAEIKKDAFSQNVLDAYTAGVNAYIQTLTESTMPLEFKLLGYKPEAWSNLKSALFVKLMSADLAGMSYARDIAFTNEKAVFSQQEMNLLYPQISDSSQPIIPKGTVFEAPAVRAVIPSTVDSLYYHNDSTVDARSFEEVSGITGSNNWAVSGSKTVSGAPMLCNDPHLRLTLPSIWYEMQLSTPTMNVYGATFASIPGVVIGFNDHVAFGVTNAGRDVIDYYRIKFKDESRQEYWYNGAWKQSQFRKEEIKKADGSVFVDSVAYTVFGPVLYDHHFNNGDTSMHDALAMRWTAHDPSNELLLWIKLDRAKNYADYREAMTHMSTPGQNFVFAAKNGDIAIGQQGRYPLRWPGQGLYVMPGEDSSYAWQGWIPQQENPHILNPAQGFVQSANQRAVDATYPYFIPGDYITPRGISAQEQLSRMQNITVDSMKRLQNDTYSTLAADAVPFLLAHTDVQNLTAKELEYLEELKHWDFHVSAQAKAPTIYQAWYDSLEKQIWGDELGRVNKTVTWPVEQTLLEALKRDSAFRFIDNINTPEVETLSQQITASFKLAAEGLVKEEAENGLVWWKHKGSVILHLLRESLLPFGRTGIQTGGWGNVLMAHTKTHGPSWRMIVHLTKDTEAYGVYPGGQSGNPGSKYYDNFIDDWSNGRYYTLWMMKEEEANDKRIIGKLTFTNS